MTRRTPGRGLLRQGLVLSLATAITWQPMMLPPAAAQAVFPGLLQLFDVPYLAGQRIAPFVMLAVTKERQLFRKAYDDWSDLDGDGVLDTSYKHQIDYYGYFDSYKCYTYNDTNRRFEPQAETSTRYCTGQWSGNFLNWATMARIDALRKVLFGGLRSPVRGADGGDGQNLSDGDTASVTVLERAFLPNDAHSFAKHYDGNDLNQLTPFTVAAPIATNVPAIALGATPAELGINTNNRRIRVGTLGSFASNGIVQVTAPDGRWVRGTITATGGTAPNQWVDVTGISAINVNGTGTNALNTWTIEQISSRGLTICNTTNGASTGIQQYSNTNTNLPRMKVARGNHALWNANERWQCGWASGANERGASNGNVFASSGLPASGSSPNPTTLGLGTNAIAGQGTYFARVQVCVPGLIGRERCKQYPNGNFKPIGVLQSFGEPDLIRFGLMTGSYRRNLSGGVLRKNIGKLEDEIDYFDGTFKTLASTGVGASPAPGNSTLTTRGGSIITTLSLFRIVGYRFDDGTYFGGVSDDACPYQRQIRSDGECKSWGNPMSEIYFEGLRYLAGQTAPTPEFIADDRTVIAGLASAVWPSNRETLLSTRNYCTPLNMLVINSSVSTNEGGTKSNGTTDANFGATSFMSGSPGTPQALTNAAGTMWGLTGSFFFGEPPSTGAGARACTGKTLTGLGDIVGVCPEGPTTRGSFLMAGLAYHARTNRIRTDIAVPPTAANLRRDPLKVDTYAVQIAGGAPRVPVRFAGESAPRVVIQPAYRLVTDGTTFTGGALVDMRVISVVETPELSTGRLMLSFEDSEAGGDYDMDVWGILSWRMDRLTNTLQITTDVVSSATANPQGFGYVISGTTADGVHFHSGILDFSYTDPVAGMSVTGDAGRINASGGCNGCVQADGPSTATYTLTSTPPAQLLEDPMYYAALFGGFQDANGNGRPDRVTPTGGTIPPSEYDKLNNRTGADVPDGIPDNYFLVNNPIGLEAGLERAFQLIAQQTSLSAVQSSSARIVAGTRVYQATFNSGDWSGNLTAYPLNVDGSLGSAIWNAASVSLRAGGVQPANRVIVTVNDATRIAEAFRWNRLSTAQQMALATLPSGLADSRGEDRLNWLRGSATHEGEGSGQFRRRVATVMPDVVNSSPVFVGRPVAGIAGASYFTFASANRGRRPMIYVGGNGGMLHGFDADTGAERLAFVPSTAYRNLSRLTTRDYVQNHRYFVDGLLSSGDAEIGGQWRTVLAAGMGAGAQGVFLLDVTDPDGFAESNASRIVRWEFTDRDDPDMGYVFAEPQIRKMSNGRWAVVVSAGYNATEADGAASTNGQGAVFILYLDGPTGTAAGLPRWVEGADYVKLRTDAGTTAAPNGVGGTATFGLSADGTVEYIYAGDLFGNVYRWNVSGDPSGWSGPDARTRIFRAVSTTGGAQPITAAPVAVTGPNNSGALILLGTGKFIERRDLEAANFRSNSLYGLWDRQNSGNDPRITGGEFTRADLMQQAWRATEANDQYTSDAVEAAARFSMLSRYMPNYTTISRPNAVTAPDPFASGPTASTPPQRGWVVDMPGTAAGERNLFKPEVVGSFVVFSSGMPMVDACSGGGAGAQYVLETLTGGRSEFGGLDRDGDRQIVGRTSSTASALGNRTSTGDRSSFGTTGGASFFSSRREAQGGFGQMTVLRSIVQSTGALCNSPIATFAPGGAIRALGVGGGCVSRLQWRELMN